MARRWKHSFKRPPNRVGQVWKDSTSGSDFVFAVVKPPHREAHGWVHTCVALEVPKCWWLKPGMQSKVTEADFMPWLKHKERLS